MTTIARYRVAWSGFTGGPGLSTFYGDNTGGAGDINPALKALFNSIGTWMPNSVTFTFPTATDLIDDATGLITGAGICAAQTNVTGSATGSYSAPVGFAIAWTTPGVLAGHRIKGHTYFVPAAQAAQGAGGALGAGVVTSIQTAANAFVTATINHALIWSRPKHDPTPPHAIVRPGVSSSITGARALPQMVVLRSRRD